MTRGSERREETARVQPDADAGIRLLAGFIDFVVAVILGSVPLIGVLVSSAYWLARDGIEVDNALRCRSMGKALTGLRPVFDDGGAIDLKASLIRNWLFGLGPVAWIAAWLPNAGASLAFLTLAALSLAAIEVALVLGDERGRRLGDRMAGTHVVVVRE